MSPTGDGLLRLTLPSMSRTAVSDGGFGDALLESFYVVHAPDSGMFVDIFARKPFAYRVLELSDPARLVVDFEPARSPLKARRRWVATRCSCSLGRAPGSGTPSP